MAIQAGVGISHHRNPKAAGQEAVQKAFDAAGIDKSDFVFMFASVGYDQQSLLDAVREATDGVPLCGCSGEGIITADEADESNFSVGVMVIHSDELRFRNGIVDGLKEDPTKAGQAIAEVIQTDVSSDTLALFMFPDGITGNFEPLKTGLEGRLQLDHPLPLVGGTAGDNWALTQTYQYCNDHVLSDGVAWALLSSSQARIAWAVNHGCVPVGVESKVTRCEGNTIYEIDGKPAIEFLKTYLSDEELANWALVIAAFSFGVKVPEQMQDYDEYIIRGMTGRDDTIGSVTIQTEVPEGTSIWMTRRDYDKIENGVVRVAKDIKTQLKDNPARCVFQFDCAGRGKLLLREQQKSQILSMLRQNIGPDAPWLGFYTLGEIAPIGTQNFFHNYTVVLAAIY